MRQQHQKLHPTLQQKETAIKQRISALPKDTEVMITFSAKTTKAGNGKEIVNVASAKADNADEVKTMQNFTQYGRPFDRKEIHQ